VLRLDRDTQEYLRTGASKKHRHLSREGLEAVSKGLESLKPVETLESKGLTYNAAARCCCREKESRRLLKILH
jgi:hypothetical protein